MNLEVVIADKLKLPLKPYQLEGVEFLLAHHYAILADSMGLGKTPQAIALSEATNSKTVVVVPPYLKINWKLEFEKFCKRPLSILIVDSNKNLPDPFDCDVVILGYTNLSHAQIYFQWANLAIFDECHYLKQMETKRSTFAHELIYESEIERMILLSGTPIENRMLEYYSPLTLCSYNPRATSGIDITKQFPTDVLFAEHFSNATLKELKLRNGRRKFFMVYEGHKNLAEFKQICEGKVIRRMAKDVLSLATPTEKEIILSYKNNPSLDKEWQEFLIDNVGGSIEEKVASAKQKVKYTINYCKDLLQDIRPILVYSDHRAPVYEIAQALGFKAITGEVDMGLRAEYVRQFQAGEIEGIVATISSFNTGVTLTKACNVIFNDISWVGTRNEQAVGRVQRIGQLNPVIVHYILGSKQDTLICRKVSAKKDLLNRLDNL